VQEFEALAFLTETGVDDEIEEDVVLHQFEGAHAEVLEVVYVEEYSPGVSVDETQTLAFDHAADPASHEADPTLRRLARQLRADRLEEHRLELVCEVQVAVEQQFLERLLEWQHLLLHRVLELHQLQQLALRVLQGVEELGVVQLLLLHQVLLVVDLEIVDLK